MHQIGKRFDTAGTARRHEAVDHSAGFRVGDLAPNSHDSGWRKRSDVKLDDIVFHGRLPITDVAARVLPLVARVDNGFAQEAIGQRLRRQLIERHLQGVKQRHAVLQAQPVPVVRMRLAARKLQLGQRLGLVKRLNVFQRLRGTTAGLVLPVPRIHEHSSCMGHATNKLALRARAIHRPVPRCRDNQPAS